MSVPLRVLLINPAITSRRHARFPLSIMTMAAALEGRCEATLIDGNVEDDAPRAVADTLRAHRFEAVGITVMGGPQVATAIEISRVVRAVSPGTPIVWGGYFPTLYPDVALNNDYVDFVIRGQGEDAMRELLDALAQKAPDLGHIDAVSWRRDGAVINNRERAFTRGHIAPAIRYELLPDPRAYLVKTFLGQRTAAHQAALGCRFRCTFCGVAAMFRGATALPPAGRLDQELAFLKHQIGADSIQFYDHNFFDREEDMQPLLEVMAGHRLPWWCYARSDALVGLSSRSWARVRQSGLRMAYIGAESPSDSMLHEVRKGTRADQTLEAVKICRAHGVIPELSFMLAPPQDPEGETEKTFRFVREVKRIHPRAEIVLYVYTPLPPSPHSRHKLHARELESAARIRDVDGNPVQFPERARDWASADWVSYWCHADAPWLTPRLRQRIRDFNTVLGCRFPTATDVRSPGYVKRALRILSSWRYRFECYDRPWELNLTRQLVTLHDPKTASL
jgi:anaerobic magnesium-protoporphyrin IX monomethyl ester cyclase